MTPNDPLITNVFTLVPPFTPKIDFFGYLLLLYTPYSPLPISANPKNLSPRTEIPHTATC